ncbi:diaminopimelate epimerase [Rhodobacterales bacterium 52_120_T64]|nr:diaminopimelate epimerase [Rhodobacterales bacterium 52_120_T64]
MTNDSHNAAIAFLKMHGLGNDFVVIDARGHDNPMTAALARAIGHRHFGIGFDQLALIRMEDNVVAVDYWNADGSLSNACGNATRCVARLLMAESGDGAMIIRTGRGDLMCEDAGNGLIRVNMGQPQLEWQDVPLAENLDTVNLPINGTPAATGMGNPHCSFFVEDAEAVDLDELGPRIENHPLFPERTNVQVVQVLDRNNLRVRVWERGVGHTLASGSSSCAVTVAAVRKGLADRKVTVHLDGGDLEIDWRDDGVWMTGPTMLVSSGTFSEEFLQAAK